MKKFSLPPLCKKACRIFLSIFLALGISITLIQDDVWLRQQCERYINQLMSHWYGCRFHADLTRLDLLTGCIELRNIVVAPLDRLAQDSWHWQACTATVSWSWRNLLRGKKCPVCCTIDYLDCTSHCSYHDNSIDLAIMPHLILLTAPPDLQVPLELEEFVLRDGLVHLYEDGNGYACHMGVAGESTYTSDALRATVRFGQGVVAKGDVTAVLRALAGKSSWYVPYGAQEATQGSLTATGELPLLPLGYQKFTVHGSLEDGEGECCIAHDNQSFQIITHIKKDNDPSGTITVPSVQGKKLHGSWHFSPTTMRGTINFGQLQATVTAEEIAVQAHVGELPPAHAGNALIGLFPQPFLKKFDYWYGDTTIFACTGDAEKFNGVMPTALLHTLAQWCGIDFQGDGDLHCTGSLLPTGLQLKLTMANAHIRIPATYGVLQKGSCTLRADLPQRAVAIEDASLELYKGTISCSQGKILFDDQGRLQYLHMPLLIRQCFFGWKKDFFAQISGACMATIMPSGEARVAGNIVVDQAQIRGNLLSADFQSEFLGAAMDSLAGISASSRHATHATTAQPCACDITYTTRTPLEIKTPFLEGAVVCYGHLGGTLQQPEIMGTFEFVRGALAFPYKPLFITKGTVTVHPESLHDPSINLVARNHVKKYDIELVISGTARNPNITFSSYPHLEQAQIITLLLGGSEDGSLYFLMPKVITNTLENLLFGSAETTSRVQKYLKNLFRPLGRVTITPRLSDQEGRGGMRGALELEVNDRLRAVIAKNISLPEDTTYEIEYDISDDSSFRVMKDERGDFGVEGEVRWKF